MLIDTESPEPLYQQVYQACRQGIIEGDYAAGEKIPAIRSLANDLGVARNTVEAAYRQLVQEGYVTSRPGSGYVVEKLNIDEMAFASDLDESFRSFQQKGQTAPIHESKPAQEVDYDFTYGNLTSDSFPAEQWRSLTTDVLYGVEAAEAAHYNDYLGDPELRNLIAQHLWMTRGVRCVPEQVVIQPGTQASLQNLLQLFDPASDTVAMEEPGYDGVRKVFENCRFEIVPCPVYWGNEVYLDAVSHSGARLAFVTPSNQFPTGRVMTLQARQRLLDWARTNDAYILEDDYCREFRYNTRPTPPLQSLDTYGHVIYMGTFSKALSPALRINYLVLPPKLAAKWKKVFDGYYSAVPWLSQMVLRRYMEKGLWDRQMRRAQTRSKRKRELLVDALQVHMGDKVELMESGAGLHLLVGVRDGRNQHELIAKALEEKVRVYETDRYWMAKKHPMKNFVLLGFSAIEDEKIEPGVQALARAWFS